MWNTWNTWWIPWNRKNVSSLQNYISVMHQNLLFWAVVGISWQTNINVLCSWTIDLYRLPALQASSHQWMACALLPCRDYGAVHALSSGVRCRCWWDRYIGSRGAHCAWTHDPSASSRLLPASGTYKNVNVCLLLCCTNSTMSCTALVHINLSWIDLKSWFRMSLDSIPTTMPGHVWSHWSDSSTTLMSDT